MGSGIAEVAARSGCDVVLREVNQEQPSKGAQRRLAGPLDKAVRNGKLNPASATTSSTGCGSPTHWTTCPECDLVAEAGIEDQDAKTAIFAARAK